MKLILSLLLLFVVAGCATPETRIRKNPELFASFTPDVQAKVRQGHVAIGFSPEAVRMALGDPDRIYHRATTNGVNDVWAYTSYDYRRDPQFVTVLSPVSDLRPNGLFVPSIVLVDVEQRQEYEALRLEFDGEKVKAIEAVKR
ncbi:MAG: hypothetical protein EPN23_07530 [Verrucomicrobia bacterium]|nr:MAG: hypothetical protein EPN23_07530 [Verrucomicrobiota bacterium]